MEFRIFYIINLNDFETRFKIPYKCVIPFNDIKIFVNSVNQNVQLTRK